MSIVTRLSQVLPAFAHVHRRTFIFALRAQDAIPHLDSACQLSDDAVTSSRAALKVASPPVPGSAFLEDVSSEYGAELIGKTVKPPTNCSSGHASRVITGFIERGDLDGAELARREFVKMDMAVEPHAGYLKMVLDALTIREGMKRSEAFFTWLSLLPPSGLSESIMSISERLLHYPFDLALLQRFCLYCAEVGITVELLRCRVLHHIFRYAIPPVTYSLLEKLEECSRTQGMSVEEVMGFRNLAIRMYYIAGRRLLAEKLTEKAEFIEPSTRFFMERNASPIRNRFLQTVQLPPASRSREIFTKSSTNSPTIPELASKLRLIRQAVMANIPPHFEAYVADFIAEYTVLSKRKRAVLSLRRKVFRSATNSARAKWVSAEQLFFSAQHYPLAILRAHLHYCVADHLLAFEIQRVLKQWSEKKKSSYRAKNVDSWLSHDLPPISTYEKVWPSRMSLSLVWKAIIQLSDVGDVERLYQMLVNHTKAIKDEEKFELETSYVQSQDSSLPIATPPAVSPTSAYFHHFIVAMATRISPLRGANVVADMQQLGLKPTVDDWGAVAGAYARSGDVRRMAVIMKHVTKIEEAAGAPGSTVSDNERKALRKRVIVMHNSVIRGLTECGMYRSARLVQDRMQRRGYFKKGVDVRTKAILHRLSRYEKGCFDKDLEQRRHILLKKRPIRVDPSRVQWKTELDGQGRPPWKSNIVKDAPRAEWWYLAKRKKSIRGKEGGH